MHRINVGVWDARARIALGLGIISLAFWGPRSPWAWLGLVPLATGILQRCPVYYTGRFSTVNRGAEEGKDKEEGHV